MDLRAFPKAELHRHLELCLRPNTIKELAPSIGIDLKSQKDFEDRFLILEPMKDLGSVLNKFLDTQKLLGSEEILERISFEACEDAFRNDDIRILELRYAPTFIESGHKLSYEQIHTAIVRGVRRAEKTYPIAVGLICILQRILPVEVGERVTDFAIEHKDSFIGLDLADNEVGFNSRPFQAAFLRARKAGLGITVHAGEAPGPDAPKYVTDAIDLLGATRIGHGLQIVHDRSAMELIRDRGVVLELCPTSNWLIGAAKTFGEHPFRRLFDFGIHTTINTDDPGIFNTSLVREYEILRDHLAFTSAEFERCAQWAAEASFIPLSKRQKVWPRPLTESQ